MEPRYLWAAVSIAFMWIAVIVLSLAGETFRYETPTLALTIPTTLVLPIFAIVATTLVGRTAFRN
jgi:hypothetical protein